MAKSKKLRYNPMAAQNRPRLGCCGTCKRQILTARYDALIRHFDPQPLSQLGELQALIIGVKTWWLFGDHFYKRTTEAIISSPSGRGGVIVRDHDCAQPQPQGNAVNFRFSNYDRDDPGF